MFKAIIREFFRLVNATKYSMQGLVSAYKSENAFRLEVWLLVILIPLAIVVSNDGYEFLVLIASWLFVILVELVNSAIEAVVDRVGTEYHELAKNSKDMASAAVLIALIIFLLTWGFIVFNNCLAKYF